MTVAKKACKCGEPTLYDQALCQECYRKWIGPRKFDSLEDRLPTLKAVDSETPPVAKVPLSSMFDVVPKKTHWLVDGFIPIGDITILEGHPKQGKSFIAQELTARVTNGDSYDLMCQNGQVNDPRNVIYITTEERDESILLRFVAAGSNTRKLKYLKWSEHDWDLTDPETLEAWVIEFNPLLIVFDPLNGVIGANTETMKDNKIRAILRPVASIASRYNCAVVIIRHWKKGNVDNILEKGADSMGITAIARSIICVGRNPQDETQHVMAQVGSNNSAGQESLMFDIQTVEMETLEGPEKVGRVRWIGPTLLNGSDLAQPPDQEKRTKVIEASDWLRDFLGTDEVPVNYCLSKAEHAGHKEKTVRSAAKLIKVHQWQESKEGERGRGQSMWSLQPPRGKLES